MGISPTIGREIARLSGCNNSSNEMKKTLRTLEVLCYIIMFIIIVFFLFFSYWISVNWLTSDHLDYTTLEKSVFIMSLVISIQFPINIYSGVLNGLQLQTLFNVIFIIFSTLKGI